MATIFPKQISLINDLERAFASTPVIKIVLRYNKKDYTVFGKQESNSFSGSVKDRMARYILRHAYQHGLIGPDWTIVEATSGNTGLAFCTLGRFLGNPIQVFIPDWMSGERFSLLELYGAHVNKISAQEGGFLGSIARAKALGAKRGFFCPQQFDNPLNPEGHYHGIAMELVGFMLGMGLEPSCFVAGVGTGGIVMGFAKLCKEHIPDCTVHPLEPRTTPILTGKIEVLGNHRIEGIADDFLPSLVNLSALDVPVTIDDGDAIIMAQKVNKCGISFGISAGANLLGTLKVLVEKQAEYGITIFCDSAIKYLSTDLTKSEPQLPHYLSNDAQIIDCEIMRQR